MRKTILGLAAGAAAFGAACTSAPAESETNVAEPPAFATPAEAEDYLTKAVPDAVAANPKYRSKDTGVVTHWMVHSIVFGKTDDGSVEVSTDESFDEYRKDKMESGTHHARFAVDEVTIEPEVSVHDVTESGKDALGVIFRCKGAPCIHAIWNGNPSMSAWTDIYIQDDATRERILAAFRALKSPGQ